MTSSKLPQTKGYAFPTLICLLRRRFMFDKIMPLSDAVEGYKLFDEMKAQKVVFKVGGLSN